MKSIYIFIVIALLYIGYVLLNNKKVFLTKKEIETFYDGMEKVDSILKEHDIPYFVIAGSLLGVARHGDIIPWDDDIDIAILDKDIDRYNSIDFKKYGYETRPASKEGCGKIFIGEGLFIDIFPFEKIEGYYRYAEPRARKLWPHEYLSDEELTPYKRYKFGRIEVSGPNKVVPYCERAFGKDGWKIGRPKGIKFVTNPITSIKMLLHKYKPVIEDKN